MHFCLPKAWSAPGLAIPSVQKSLLKILSQLQHVRIRLQYAQTASNMSSCNILENEATFLAVTYLNRWLYIWLQHAQTVGNMSGCNMLELEAICPAAKCLNRRHHVRLQHAWTSGNMSGCNILEQGARLCCILLQLAFFMGSSMSFLLRCRQNLTFFSPVRYIAKKC